MWSSFPFKFYKWIYKCSSKSRLPSARKWKNYSFHNYFFLQVPFCLDSSHVTTVPLYSTWPACESIKAGHTWYLIVRHFISEVINRPCSLSENSVASYSMLIGGTCTASIQDKRTHSSMYSFTLAQIFSSGKSYKVLQSCLLTSCKEWKNVYT